MKKRWKIFWIVCGSMFLIGIICCSVSWGMGTSLTDIAHQFPHGISWVSEDKTYGDPPHGWQWLRQIQLPLPFSHELSSFLSDFCRFWAAALLTPYEKAPLHCAAGPSA